MPTAGGRTGLRKAPGSDHDDDDYNDDDGDGAGGTWQWILTIVFMTNHVQCQYHHDHQMLRSLVQSPGHHPYHPNNFL